ncbi:DNA-directed RNA polymerase core subunit rpc40 [Puccinia graminis f. sp. tritici]|uniref:DNA-directed RNA polymerases I and III subunit RPAC1 n=1 Tax=Puccinia graminis f. sp. tritici TaxID=56615 RepID=A0A5B0RF80_PUCGR|nr:DNA-directed RNA polymerase core subunit rpc40 [Puccinia graminis f. sp. tritici]
MADHGILPPGFNPDTTSTKLNPKYHVKLEAEKVLDVAANDFPGHWPGESNAWDIQTFKKNLKIKICRLSSTSMEFDLIGIDASIANALRRIMLAEVPTVAIEDVFVWNNTSLVHDEVLAQRLGLVPLKIDPRLIDMRTDEGATDLNTIVFKLVVNCRRNPHVLKTEKDPLKLYQNSLVTTEALEWEPKGDQVDMFGSEPPRPVQNDIVLVKMRPGQEIRAEMHCVKGIAKDHAKFSPVATASYRLLPHIVIHEPIPEPDCLKFQSCFSPGVIEIVNGPKGGKTCKVKNPRNDSVSREVLRHPEFEGKVTLGRVRDHFICESYCLLLSTNLVRTDLLVLFLLFFLIVNVESTGVYSPQEIPLEACEVLLLKIRTVRASLKLRADAML